MSAETKLTEMQAFCLESIKKEKGKVNAGWLAAKWAKHKHRRPYGSSRDLFGTTSAAYRTLRGLYKLGLISKDEYRTPSGYLVEDFSINKKLNPLHI